MRNIINETTAHRQSVQRNDYLTSGSLDAINYIWACFNLTITAYLYTLDGDIAHIACVRVRGMKLDFSDKTN